MAPRSSSKKAKRHASTAAPGTIKEDDEKPINIWDTTSVKHALDEAASETILDHGYDEDHFVSNVKIALGLISIALALLAQFWPGKFHANWWIVFWCVVAYVVVTAILTLFCAMREGNAFMFAKPAKGATLMVSSTLPRFSDKYTLKIGSTGGATGRRSPVEATHSIAKYFHSDGYLELPAFEADVVKLLHAFERKD